MARWKNYYPVGFAAHAYLAAIMNLRNAVWLWKRPAPTKLKKSEDMVQAALHVGDAFMWFGLAESKNVTHLRATHRVIYDALREAQTKVVLGVLS